MEVGSLQDEAISDFFGWEAARYRIRQDYAKEFDKGQVEAEKIYAQLCLSLVRKVPEHNLDLSRLQSGEASAQEANEKLMAAIQLNEERKRKLSSWLDEVGRMVRVRFMNSWEMSIQRCLRCASIDVILGFFWWISTAVGTAPTPPFPNSTFVACWILSISFNFFQFLSELFFSIFLVFFRNSAGEQLEIPCGCLRRHPTAAPWHSSPALRRRGGGRGRVGCGNYTLRSEDRRSIQDRWDIP